MCDMPHSCRVSHQSCVCAMIAFMSHDSFIHTYYAYIHTTHTKIGGKKVAHTTKKRLSWSVLIQHQHAYLSKLFLGTGTFLNPKLYYGRHIKRVCRSVLQHVAVCYSVLQCFAVCCGMRCTVLHCVVLCCTMLQ